MPFKEEVIEKPAIIIPSEKELIEEIYSKKKSIHNARHSYEKTWLTSIAFLFGKQYFDIDKRPMASIEDRVIWEIKNLERKKKTRRTSNYILPLYRSLLARLLMMKANINTEPLTRSARDVDSAKVSQEVLEDFWLNVNKSNPILSQNYAGMLQVLGKLFGYLLTIGNAYLKPSFNPETNAKVFIGDEVGDYPVGNVEAEVISMFDIFPDPMKRFLIQRRVMDVDDIKNLYDVEIKAQKVGQSDIEKQLLNLMDAREIDSDYENSAEVMEYWCVPSKEYPQGRFVMTTEDKLILDTVIPPELKNRMPYFRFRYIDIVMSPLAQGMIEQIINLQEDYNFTISRLHEYKKWFAGKLKVPKNCKLETKYDDEIGQVIKYDAAFGEPHFETPPPPPNFLTEETVRIKRDMEDVSSIHDASMGRIPEQAKSGIAIENLSELDNSSLSPVLIGIETQLAFFCEMALDIVEAKYSESRILGITGETLGAEIKTFKGEDVKGNKRIKITLGSSMPISKQARQQFIMLLAEKNYITREKALELMEFGDLEGLYQNLDESAAKMENQEMLSGNSYPEPQTFDDQTRHLKVHTDFMKTEQYKTLDEQIKMAFQAHYQKHQEFLQAEMQAAQNMPRGGQ